MINDINPEFQFCPKCGSASFATQDGGRSFSCEGCHFQYFINNSAAVAGLIFNSLGELLLTRRAYDPAKGMLDLPGGFVEPMESAEEALVREIMEELNLRVTRMSYLVSFPNLYPFSKIVVPTVDMAFVCEVDHFESLKADDDVADVVFIRPDQIRMDALCSDSMRKIIHNYLEKYFS